MPILRLKRSQYRVPRLPKSEWMLLVDPETGAEDGPFRVADFQRRPDGSWAAATAGHPVFLRVVEQKGDVITSLDGGGTAWRYRLVPVADDEVTGEGPRAW